MSGSAHDLPAILGGPPAFPEGPPPWPFVEPRVSAVLRAVAEDGSWGRYHGPHVDALRERFRRDLGCGQVELCASGTAAIELALRALQVGEGSEVILAAYDYRAAFRTVLALGARPLLVDVDPANCSVVPASIETAVSKDTAAIVVSHLHGGLVNMPAIMELAARHGVPVVEDACQASGAALCGRPAGTLGTLGVFSFGGSKLLTAGRGGAVVGDDARLFQRMRLYSVRGNEAYPLSELQAAVLGPQLDELEQRTRVRAERARRLFAGLSRIEGLTPFVNTVPDARAAFYKVGLRYDPAGFAELPRDAFAQAMRAEGIACDEGFGALHLTTSRSRFRQADSLDGATKAHETVLQIHHPILLQGDEAIDTVVAAASRIAEQAAAVLARHAEKGARSAASPGSDHQARDSNL